jgi:hypothetical protein
VNTKILKELIAVIRIEQERRLSKLKDEDPNIAYDQWLFTDEPFLNELCLMLLVTLRHQIERELVGLAARADEGSEEISRQQFQEKVRQLRKTNRKGKNIGWDWMEMSKRLKLEFYEKYKFIEALRLLSNSYKHDPSMEPDEELLNLLSLETGVNYAPLPESDALRKGFADFIGLKEDANYCDIANQFLEVASNFLVEVESQAKLSKVNWGAASLNPNDFAR